MVDGKLGADGMNRRDGPLRRAEPRIERMTRMSRVRKPALSGEDGQEGRPAAEGGPHLGGDARRDYKKSFFRQAKYRVFLFKRKGLLLLGKSEFFSQRFMKGEKRVNPTIGFRFRFSEW